MNHNNSLSNIIDLTSDDMPSSLPARSTTHREEALSILQLGAPECHQLLIKCLAIPEARNIINTGLVHLLHEAKISKLVESINTNLRELKTQHHPKYKSAPSGTGRKRCFNFSADASVIIKACKELTMHNEHNELCFGAMIKILEIWKSMKKAYRCSDFLYFEDNSQLTLEETLFPVLLNILASNEVDDDEKISQKIQTVFWIDKKRLLDAYSGSDENILDVPMQNAINAFNVRSFTNTPSRWAYAQAIKEADAFTRDAVRAEMLKTYNLKPQDVMDYLLQESPPQFALARQSLIQFFKNTQSSFGYGSDEKTNRLEALLKFGNEVPKSCKDPEIVEWTLSTCFYELRQNSELNIHEYQSRIDSLAPNRVKQHMTAQEVKDLITKLDSKAQQELEEYEDEFNRTKESFIMNAGRYGFDDDETDKIEEFAQERAADEMDEEKFEFSKDCLIFESLANIVQNLIRMHPPQMAVVMIETLKQHLHPVWLNIRRSIPIHYIALARQLRNCKVAFDTNGQAIVRLVETAAVALGLQLR